MAGFSIDGVGSSGYATKWLVDKRDDVTEELRQEI
jgi:hypothetical protein